ncbi:MAG: hypothetical protein MI865_07050 [Proteobacteria bacterium]|nr:hypothetical protein [Pseudomonadota bacterium]
MNKKPFIILFILICACSDNYDSYYADLEDAIKDGAVMRNLLPPWLPDTAKDIHISHNRSGSIVSIHLSYTGSWSLPGSCRIVNPYEARSPQIKTRSWPIDIPPDKNSDYKHLYYLCNDLDYLALAPDKGEAFYWKVEVN